MKLMQSRLIGNIILFILFGLFCAFMYNASAKIDYVWRWNKVPAYIVSKKTEEFRARTNGTVVINGSAIYLKTPAGNKELVAKNATTLLKKDGDAAFFDEKIAVYSKWQLGPLTLGLLMTLKISLFSIVFAILIGIFTGMMRISPIYVFKRLSLLYVELVRGTPLLVQIFLLYFFFGKIFNLGQIAACVASLSIFTGAYIAEIVRAGVQSVQRGQTEAARSLGMNYLQTMRYIILPQALKRTLPPMAGQFISLIKDSSLVSVIAITDLTKAGREVISATLSPFEVWFTVAAMYLILTAILSYLISRLELRMSRAD